MFSSLSPAACCAWGQRRLPQPCVDQSPAAVAICCLLLSESVVALQTLAEFHGHLRTHADIKMDNIHVAVMQRPADTTVTVLDFGLCHFHLNGGSLSRGNATRSVVTLLPGDLLKWQYMGSVPQLTSAPMLGTGLARVVPCTGCTCLVPRASATPCLCLLLGASQLRPHDVGWLDFVAAGNTSQARACNAAAGTHLVRQQWEGIQPYAPPELLESRLLPITLCGFEVPTLPYAADAWGVRMLTAEVGRLTQPLVLQLPHTLLRED